MNCGRYLLIILLAARFHIVFSSPPAACVRHFHAFLISCFKCDVLSLAHFNFIQEPMLINVCLEPMLASDMMPAIVQKCSVYKLCECVPYRVNDITFPS